MAKLFQNTGSWFLYFFLLALVPSIFWLLNQFLGLTRPRIFLNHISYKPTREGNHVKIILLSLTLLAEGCLRKNRLEILDVVAEFENEGSRQKFSGQEITPLKEILNGPLGHIELSHFDAKEIQGIIYINKNFDLSDFPLQIRLVLTYKDLRNRILQIKHTWKVIV